MPISSVRVVQPFPLRGLRPLPQLFLSLHKLSHPGVRASRRLLSSRFVWPCLSKDVGLWTRSCLQCQQSKIQSHVKSTVPSIDVPGRRFSHVHLDLVGPLPSSQGYSYLLTMIKRSLPKDNYGFSPAEAVYGSNLFLPGEFLEYSEIPPESFLRKVDLAVQGFSGPPRHHMTSQPQPQPLPRVLMEAKYMFV